MFHCGQLSSLVVVILIGNMARTSTVCYSNPTHFNTRFRKHGGPWLGKRVIAVGLDVLKMETLGGLLTAKFAEQLQMSEFVSWILRGSQAFSRILTDWVNC